MDGVWMVEESFMLLSFLYLPIYSLFWWFYSLAFTILIYTAKSLLDSWTTPWFGDKTCSYATADIVALIFYELSSKKMNEWLWKPLQQTHSWNPRRPTAIQPAEQVLNWDTGNCIYSLSRDPISADRISYYGMPSCAAGRLWAAGEVMLWDCFPRQFCSVCVEAYGLPNVVPPRHTGTARTCFLVCVWSMRKHLAPSLLCLLATTNKKSKIHTIMMWAPW